MILFPNSKINTGLHILGRRDDGYHDISTIMIPVDWCDILEIVPSASAVTTLTVSGRHAPGAGDAADNLVLRALRHLEAYLGRSLPPVDIYLDKNVPTGAGLGGGSADAAFTLMGLNDLFGLGLDKNVLADIAAGIGADCPFFIYNRPMLAQGIGQILTPAHLPEGSPGILIVKAGDGVPTGKAYAAVDSFPTPFHKPLTAESLVSGDWPALTNDFEAPVFALRPELAQLKADISAAGAWYCSMSGSGAAVFGLFDNDKMSADACESIRKKYPDADIFCSRLFK